MNFVTSTFAILIAVAIALSMSKFIPRFPNNFISLLVGVLFGIIPLTNQYVLEFNNDIFMLFILVPLLFFEGHKTPLVNVLSNAKNIISTSVLLVMISAIFTAFLLSTIFGLAFALSCVLVAISTLTDVTAFESVINGRQFPERVKKQLVGAALFNDATGINLLESAILWYTTKHLSISDGLIELLYSAIGSILVGAILSFIFMLVRQRIVQISKNQMESQMLLYIFTPFIIYLIAEHLGLSGILTVVIAGIIHNSE